MKVLVTGASGFLGGYVLASLYRRGIETIVIGRKRPVGGQYSGFIEADLLSVRDFGDVLSDAKASHLLHLAWYAEHGKYWKSPLNLRWVEATIRLVEAFSATGGQRFVGVGTCAEYDWSYGYCREDTTPLNPTSLYGVAKDAARRMVEAICEQSGVSWAWARVFFPYGPGDSPHRLVPSLIKVFRGQRDPFGVNAEAYRDFVHASDLGDAFAALLTHGQRGSYNVCSAQPLSIGDLVRRIALLMTADPAIVLRLTADQPGGPALLVGENTKLKALGWTPRVFIDDGLKKMIADTIEE